MGHGVSSSNKVLFVIASLIVSNGQNSRLELGDVGDVVGSDSVLSLRSWNADAKHRGTLVNGFVGDGKVESDRFGNFTREGSPGGD